MTDITQLEEALSDPPGYAIDAMGRVSGDIVVLGAGGKMGPTLARMARRASDAAGVGRRVIAVSRFSTPGEEDKLNSWGVETIQCDLLDPDSVAALPDAPNVIFMAGVKFGTHGREALTWATNCCLPGFVCHRYRGSRIVVFSTGNVYGTVPVDSGGSLETDIPDPVGEYAMSALGRERVFEHFSGTLGIPVAIVRLNYACELRYGVLVDIAGNVWTGRPIDLTMGYANVIWQGDANAQALAALAHVSRPPFVINVSGPETLKVRAVAQRFGELFGKQVEFSGAEHSDALLSNTSLAQRLFGPPRVSTDQLVEWIADWVRRGGESLGKPTHFEARNGRF